MPTASVPARPCCCPLSNLTWVRRGTVLSSVQGIQASRTHMVLVQMLHRCSAPSPETARAPQEASVASRVDSTCTAQRQATSTRRAAGSTHNSLSVLYKLRSEALSCPLHHPRTHQMQDSPLRDPTATAGSPGLHSATLDLLLQKGLLLPALL